MVHRAGASILIVNVSLATALPSDCHSRWVLKGLVLVIPGGSDSQPVKVLWCHWWGWDLGRDQSQGNKSFGPMSYRIFIIPFKNAEKGTLELFFRIAQDSSTAILACAFLYKLVWFFTTGTHWASAVPGFLLLPFPSGFLCCCTERQTICTQTWKGMWRCLKLCCGLGIPVSHKHTEVNWEQDSFVRECFKRYIRF